MPNSSILPPPVLSVWSRLLAHPLSRIVMASLAVTLPIAVTLFAVQHMLDKSLRQFWPQLLCTVLCVACYGLYVRKIEKREVSELSSTGAGFELGLGVVIGSMALLMVIGTLFGGGSFQVNGFNSWTVMLSPLTELTLVAFFEEILFRGIILRLLALQLDLLPSLLLSAGLFALAHLPNAGISLLGVAVTVVAGLMFGAAYLATKRLWLAIGIHFSWNFLSDAVFSLPTSGHPARGLILGQLSGPDWLSGGTYGIEASVVTLVIISTVTLWLLSTSRR